MEIDTGGDVRAWLRAANPFRRSRDLTEAARAARVGAWALLLFGLSRLGDAIWIALWPEVYLQGVIGTLGDVAPGPALAEVIAEAGDMAVSLQVVAAATWGFLALALAAAQWRWMTGFLPGGLAALQLYGFFSLAVTAAIGPALPLNWPFSGGLPATFAAMVLAIAGARGGMRLRALRRRGT